MFVDRVKVQVVAGKGGNGIVAWRREKGLAKGGPYGGNGGRGGSVIIQADSSYYSLDTYRRRRVLKAKNGQEGGTNLRQGGSGEKLIVKVPFGTLVKDQETGEILHDFTPEENKWVACEGGRGGKGNNFFKSSTNRAPSRSTFGTPGQERHFELELKLIADVGLVGMPNAGKSTLMSKITHAQVKIGAYAFTTLSPNLSYVQCEDYTRILVADIPGIIENAHQNKGLGIEFLKHIERTSALVFVIDAAGGVDRDPYHDFEILCSELRAYNPDLLKKPFFVALNKTDVEDSKDHIASFRKQYPFGKETLFEISAIESKGLESLIEALRKLSLSKTLHTEYQPA